MFSRVNYTPEEKQDLKKLIKNYPILYEKRTDNVGQKPKRKAWANLTSEFNAMPNHLIEVRTAANLYKHCTVELTDEVISSIENRNAVEKTMGKFENFVQDGVVCTEKENEGDWRRQIPEDDPDLELMMNTFANELEGAVDSDTAFTITPTTPCKVREFTMYFYR